MKAFVLDRYGNKGGLRADEMPEPINEAMAYVETGRAKGKVVVRVK